MPISGIGKEKLVYDPAFPIEGDNVGSFTRAGSDGQPITWTNVGLTAAQFSGQVAGMTTNVTIDADVPGSAGNITLVADSVSTIAQLVAAWNLANPSNTVTVSSGDDTQIPTANIVLSGGADGKDGLDVNIINSLSITSNYEYAEDTQHASGDIGAFALAVRNDNDAILTSQNGDYSPISVDQYGRLKTVTDLDVDFDFVYAEDTQHQDGALGAFTLGVAQTALAASVTTDGDYGAFKLNDRGALWVAPVGTVADDVTDTENPVKIGSKSVWGALAPISADGDRANLISDKFRRAYVNSGANIAMLTQPVAVTSTVAKIVSANLSGRRNILIQNLSAKAIYIGYANTVTALSGIRIAASASLTLDVGENIDVWAIGSLAGPTGHDVRVMELG